MVYLFVSLLDVDLLLTQVTFSPVAVYSHFPLKSVNCPQPYYILRMPPELHPLTPASPDVGALNSPGLRSSGVLPLQNQAGYFMLVFLIA